MNGYIVALVVAGLVVLRAGRVGATLVDVAILSAHSATFLLALS